MEHPHNMGSRKAADLSRRWDPERPVPCPPQAGLSTAIKIPRQGGGETTMDPEAAKIISANQLQRQQSMLEKNLRLRKRGFY